MFEGTDVRLKYGKIPSLQRQQHRGGCFAWEPWPWIEALAEPLVLGAIPVPDVLVLQCSGWILSAGVGLPEVGVRPRPRLPLLSAETRLYAYWPTLASRIDNFSAP